MCVPYQCVCCDVCSMSVCLGISCSYNDGYDLRFVDNNVCVVMCGLQCVL